MGLIYSPVGTQRAGCRPPVCRCLSTARSVPSRTAETHLARPPRRPRVPPTTSPACPASRSHSSASWCPACPVRPPARARPAETQSQHVHMSLSVVEVVEQLLFLMSAILCKVFPDHTEEEEEKKKKLMLHVLLPGKNVNIECSGAGIHGVTHTQTCACVAAGGFLKRTMWTDLCGRSPPDCSN